MTAPCITIPFDELYDLLATKSYRAGVGANGLLLVVSTHEKRGKTTYPVVVSGGALVHRTGEGDPFCGYFRKHGYCCHILKVAEFMESHMPYGMAQVRVWQATEDDPYRVEVRARMLQEGRLPAWLRPRSEDDAEAALETLDGMLAAIEATAPLTAAATVAQPLQPAPMQRHKAVEPPSPRVPQKPSITAGMSSADKAAMLVRMYEEGVA